MNSKFNIVTAAFTLLIAASGFGQTQMIGKLVDRETKKPIKDGKITVEGTNLETISNALGFFQLPIDTLTFLIIECAEYETGRIQVSPTDNYKIELSRIKDDVIFVVVEESAYFPGGIGEFYNYLERNLKYPADARNKGISGKVFVQFVIEKTGVISPEEVKIAKGLHKSCDEEALRLMRESPNWIPGKQRGKPVRQTMVLPIIFK